MLLTDIKANDVLVSVDCRGASYYRVLKVCKIKIRVKGENGSTFLAYPNLFDRKIDYPVNV